MWLINEFPRASTKASPRRGGWARVYLKGKDGKRAPRSKPENKRGWVSSSLDHLISRHACMLRSRACAPVLRLRQQLAPQLLPPCLLLDAPLVFAVVAHHAHRSHLEPTPSPTSKAQTLALPQRLARGFTAGGITARISASGTQQLLYNCPST